MKTNFCIAAVAASITFGTAASAQVACLLAGPQTPRDISSALGLNSVTFPTAPPASEMNLCDIHTHTNAEHKGPGFTVYAGDGDHGGYKCNNTEELTEAELAMPHGDGGHGVKPGDTIEVHWVHTTCDVAPGPGLGSCLCETDASGANPQLRVESQVFLVVNDQAALNFADYLYEGNMVGDLHQAKALPSDTGSPVEFLGSTTGPSYNSSDKCSSPKVTWSVRPQCAKVDVSTVNEFLSGKSVFKEDHSHGVRQLVTKPELLAPIGG